MIISYQIFEIELRQEQGYLIKSKNNTNTYQFEYHGGQIIKNLVYPLNKRGIIVRNQRDNSEVASAILCENGGKSVLDDHAFSLIDDSIWICIGDKLYCLALPNLQVQWFGDIGIGSNYSIQSFEEDVLVFGELGVVRLGNDGSSKWQYKGGGIFLPGADKWSICGNQIVLLDANKQKHHLDTNGTLI